MKEVLWYWCGWIISEFIKENSILVFLNFENIYIIRFSSFILLDIF